MTTDNKVGRPKNEIDDEDFARLIGMAEISCTQDEICDVFDMAESTLDLRLKERGYTNFRDFYKKHQGKGKTSLRRMQWKAAEAGSVPILIWLGKNMLDQTDRQEPEEREIPPINIVIHSDKVNETAE